MGLFNLLSPNQKDKNKKSSDFFSLFTDNPEAIIILDFEGEIVSINKNLSSLLGYRMKERDVLEKHLFQSKEHDKVRYHFHKATQGFSTSFEMSIHQKSGRTLPINISLIPSETFIFAVCKDMTTVKSYENKITRISDQLEDSQRITNIGNWQHDVKSDKTHWSKQIYKIMGISALDFEINSETVYQYVHPHDKEIYLNNIRLILEKKEELDFEQRIVRPDGEERVIFVRANVILDEDGEVERTFGTIQDITEIRTLELKLEESEGRYKSVADHLSVGIWSHDLENNNITFCSKGLENIFGTSIEELKLTPDLLKEYILPEDRGFVEKDALLLSEGKDVNHEFRILDANGQIKWIEGQIIPHLDREGNVVRVDGIVRDITESVNYTESLAFMADHDYLTKLPNRRYNERKIQELIEVSSRKNDSFSVFYLDLDRFKYINDTFGHEVGDRFLVSFSERMQAHLGPEVFLSRIGGDEFIVLSHEIKELEEAIKLANGIIDEIEKPFYIDGYELLVTTSIGISMYPMDGKDYRTILRNADAALYKAKELGRNTWQIFSASMNVESFKLYHLEKDLKKSLINDELYIEYQPKVNPKTSRIEGAEALVRWNHPEWGSVSPKEFIPLAEESGFIFKMGDWVTREVCETLGKWKKQGLPIVPVSVNISPKRLLKAGFVETLMKMIEEAGIEPGLIELELTEQTIIKNTEVAKSIITELKEFGVKVALDDFGTGYSSLSYLKDLDIDTLKIDKSFIDGLTLKNANDAIVKSLIYLSKEVGINIVAEGVETKEQLNFLLQQECQQIQGYIYSKPVSVKKLKSLLKKGFIKPLQTSAVVEAIKNRRKYYRISLDTPLTAEMTIVKFKNKEVKLGSSRALIENLSLGGLKYLSNINLPIQKDMVIMISTQILGMEVKFFGRNVWKLEENGFHEYGFEFILHEVERDRLAPLFNKMVLQLKESTILPDSSILQEKKGVYLKG
ncbi:EAL domain-containing protein [Robertmurraya sp. 2P01SA]